MPLINSLPLERGSKKDQFFSSDLFLFFSHKTEGGRKGALFFSKKMPLLPLLLFSSSADLSLTF